MSCLIVFANAMARVTTRRAVHRSGVLVGFALMVLQAGCAQDSSPQTYPVQGKVIYKSNQQPLGQGTVLLNR
jgi:hypothetical protein